MSDLIDRQAAIAVADSSDYVGLSVDDVKKVTDEVVKGLKQLPSAQPEIIRCKDCVNCSRDAIFDDYWCGGKEVEANHYCGYAERRIDE